jgi:predicted DNA-binding transcriptional regulator YafY
MALDKESGTELAKIYRIFRLIELLSSPPFLTTIQLAVRLEVTERSVRRYYPLLEKLGYLVDKDPRTHRYFIQVESGLGDAFDGEEAAYLNDLLSQLPEDNPVRSSTLLKINKQYRLYPVMQTVQRNTHYLRLKRLQEAVKNSKVVVLHNYEGANGKISTRRIVVTGFTDRFRGIHAHDLEADGPRQFLLDRMGLIEITAEDVPQDFPFYPNDLFDWPGTTWFNVSLLLSVHAKKLLTEEYPRSRANLSMALRDGRYRVDLRVRGWNGIGRFILGLPGEVEVTAEGDGEVLRAYLNGRVCVW